VNAVPERSLGTMVRDIGGNVDRLVRAEMGFAVAELRLRLEAFRGESLLLFAGVAAAALAAAFILLGGMFGLAHVMPMWLSAIVIAALPAAIAAMLYFQVREQIARRLASKPRKLLSGPRGVT
jgi:Putative Actinobacterial Holin-X, holin superfamily III